MKKLFVILFLSALVFSVSAKPALAFSQNTSSINSFFGQIQSIFNSFKNEVKPRNDIKVSYELVNNNHELNIYFKRLQNANSVSWEISYLGDGIPQGAVGNVDLSGGVTEASANVVFGTCSQGVCTYYVTVKKVKLVVTADLNNGQTSVQTYYIIVK